MSAPSGAPPGSTAVPEAGPGVSRDPARPAPPAFGPGGFLFDPGRCTGCNACEIACATENELDFGTSWRQVLPYNPARIPGLPSFHLSMACNHCAEAPCVAQCPARAITRAPDTGAVLIDPGRCIGCRYCAWVCPFDAPRFDAGARVMTKCTGCHPRLVRGQVPACVEQCPTDALGFGLLTGEESLPGVPASPARPALRFPSTHRPLVPPHILGAAAGSVPEPAGPAREPGGNGPRITLVGEWPLLVFSLLVSLLAGWMLARLPGRSGPPLPWFLGLAATAAAVSTFHLARPRRAWRALLGWRRSWLSREILAFTLFVPVSVLALLRGPGTFTILAGLLGVATVYCIDRVYDPVRRAATRPAHSADATTTAVALAALLAGLHGWFVLFGVVKVALYTRRRRDLPRSRVFPVRSTAVVRVLAGFVAPALLRIVFPGVPLVWSVLAFFAGEGIDRIEFYAELEIETPRLRLDRRLEQETRALAAARR
jgi:Fe-S-cluster-containing dehydrogenase component/DMSO reductase anchor subunit